MATFTSLVLLFALSAILALENRGIVVTAFTANGRTMSSKRVLVTGGNKGIGKAICKKLLEEHPDVHVLLGSRDRKRGEEALQELIAETSTSAKDRIDLVQIDTSDDKSVQDAAAKLSDQPSLYGVVNNAGIGWGHSLQDTIETNYFGVRRVCSSLTPHLQNPGGRIVNIASASGPMYVSKCNDNELKSKFEHPLTTTLAELDKIAKRYQESKTYDDGEAYGFSKALVNAFTVLYAKEHPSLIVNSCTPGYIKTDLTAGSGATNTPEKGAISPVHLLMSSEIEKLPTGRYYGSDAVRSPLDRYRGPGDSPFVEETVEQNA